MGYKKATKSREIRVPMLVNVSNEDTGNINQVKVVHIFRTPPLQVREEYKRKLVIVKGTKVKSGHTSDAHFYLWLHCVLRVEGYDDLPSGDNWKSYFEGDEERYHVDGAIEKLNEILSTEEDDEEKKSEQSSVL